MFILSLARVANKFPLTFLFLKCEAICYVEQAASEGHILGKLNPVAKQYGWSGVGRFRAIRAPHPPRTLMSVVDVTPSADRQTLRP